MNVLKGFKQTEVGVIPEDWETSALGENVTVNSGESPSKFEILSFGIPYFKVEQLNNSRKYARRSKYYIESCESIPEGSLIFPKRGASIFLNKIRILKQPSYMDTNLMTLTVSKKWNYEYIYYQLLHIGLWKVADTTSVPQINNKHIVPFQIPLPPTRAEQTAIATALSDMDTLIEGVEKLLEKKRRIKQGAMQELLTGKRRVSGFESKKGVQQTEVGIIPKDWLEIKLSDFTLTFRGGAPLAPSDFTDKGVKVLPKVGIIKGGILKIEKGKQQYCSQEYAERHQANIVDNNFIIVVLRDLVPSGPNIGLMVRIDSSDRYVLAQGTYGFTVNLQQIDPNYLIHFSNTAQYRKIMHSIMVGSTQVHITNGLFKQVKIPLPPTKAEQKEIASILSNMDTEIKQLETQRTKYQQLKTGMMQELLTGKKRLV